MAKVCSACGKKIKNRKKWAASILRDVLARGPAIRTPCPFCQNVFTHSEDCPGEEIVKLLEEPQ